MTTETKRFTYYDPDTDEVTGTLEITRYAKGILEAFTFPDNTYDLTADEATFNSVETAPESYRVRSGSLITKPIVTVTAPATASVGVGFTVNIAVSNLQPDEIVTTVDVTYYSDDPADPSTAATLNQGDNTVTFNSAGTYKIIPDESLYYSSGDEVVVS